MRPSSSSSSGQVNDSDADSQDDNAPFKINLESWENWIDPHIMVIQTTLPVLEYVSHS